MTGDVARRQADRDARIDPDPWRVGQQVFREMYSHAETPRDGRETPGSADGCWYCPCAGPEHARLIRYLMGEYDLARVYDLGAGDLRLAAALAPDFEVVAYERDERLAARAYQMHGQPPLDVRVADYYDSWAGIRNERALFAAIGKTNDLPGTPENGVGLCGAEELCVTLPGE